MNTFVKLIIAVVVIVALVLVGRQYMGTPAVEETLTPLEQPLAPPVAAPDEAAGTPSVEAAPGTEAAAPVAPPATIDLNAYEHVGGGLMELLKPQAGEQVMGKASAPVTIVEYISFTCKHCAEFHAQQFDQLTANYIDNGKANLILRFVPWDDMATAASKVVMCGRPETFFGLSNLLLSRQSTWVASKTPVEEIKTIVRMGGLSAFEVDECIGNNPAVQEKLNAMAETAKTQLGVKATPTFFINGYKVEGAQKAELLGQIIEAVAIKASNPAPAKKAE